MLSWVLSRVFACYALVPFSALFFYLDWDASWVLATQIWPWALVVLQIARHSSLGMTIGFHRYYSHHAFKAPRWLELLIAYSCCASNQGAMSWWAGTHRYHHVHCDSDLDPHSPVKHSILYAWLGWGYDPKHALRKIKLRHAEIRVLDNWCFVIPWLEFGLFWLVSGSLAFATFVSLLPAALSPIGTLFFNCMSHGGKPDEKGCTARKYWQISAILLGEHDHKDHHLHPAKAHRPGPDLPYWLILWPLAKFGIIDNLR